MIKKRILFFFPVILLSGIFFCGTVFAQTQQTFPDGTVLQIKNSQQKFFIFNGKKMKIATPYTFKELGVAKKDVVNVSEAALAAIPDGETLRISPPRIRGMFDMHEHFRAGGNAELYLDVASKLGIAKTVFVPTGSGPDNKGYKEHMAALLALQKKYPDQVIAYCTVDEADPQAPEIFEKCLDNGGKGLKLIGGHPEFYDVPLNNDVVRQLFEIARDRDVPVLVHVSIITLTKAKDEFKSVLSEFPDVRVQFAHYCSSIYNGINLEQCSEFLDAYPNLYIDLTMGGGILRYFKYMTEDMKKIRDFVLKYQDRILSGSDLIIASGSSPTTNRQWLRNRMMCDFSLHQEKWYKCSVMNKGEYALLPGFGFPEEVLRKLYIENPKKFLGLSS